jgi:hypothetical protein
MDTSNLPAGTKTVSIIISFFLYKGGRKAPDRLLTMNIAEEYKETHRKIRNYKRGPAN